MIEKFFLLILIVLPFRLYHLGYPLLDVHHFRQAQTATITKNFYENGINLLQTELDIFGIGKEKYLTLEFPLYEAIVAILYRIFFVSDIWGRTVSIISGFIGACYLYKLVILISKNKKLAYFSSFFFLFTPLNMFYQRTFMIESTVIAFLLAGLFYACRWVEKQDNLNFIFSLFFLTLGFVQKAPYGPFIYLPIIVYAAKKIGWVSLINTKLILIILIPLISLVVWQKHVDYVNTQSGQTYFTSYSRGLREWNFGTFQDRLSWEMWNLRLKQIKERIFFNSALVLFIIGLLSVRRDKLSLVYYSYLLSQVIYFFTFFRIQSHNYYQTSMIPSISIILAFGVVTILNWSLKIIDHKYLQYGIITIISIFYIFRSWTASKNDFEINKVLYERLLQIREAIESDSYGILVTNGYDWNSVYTYIPQKKMLLVKLEDFKEKRIKEWKSQGYSFVVFLGVTKNDFDFSSLNYYKNGLNLVDSKVFFF